MFWRYLLQQTEGKPFKLPSAIPVVIIGNKATLFQTEQSYGTEVVVFSIELWRIRALAQTNTCTHVWHEDLHADNVVVSCLTAAPPPLSPYVWPASGVTALFLLSCLVLVAAFLRSRQTLLRPQYLCLRAPLRPFLCLMYTRPPLRRPRGTSCIVGPQPRPSPLHSQF